jgi:hypothetical protein
MVCVKIYVYKIRIRIQIKIIRIHNTAGHWYGGGTGMIVLRIRIRDPVPFYPKDPGSGMTFFPDPGSRIPDPYHVPNSIYLQNFTFKMAKNRKN